jgi:hypothetical protein
MIPKFLKAASALRVALKVCNCWSLYCNAKIFSQKKSVFSTMYKYFLEEYQMEYLGLSEYRSSSSTEEDLLRTLIHLQVQYKGELGLEFRCLGKAISKLEVRTSPLEVEPNFHKFVLSKHATEWHISTALQTYSFLVSKSSTTQLLLEKVMEEMKKKGILVLYGIFRDKIDQHMIDIFNEQHGCNVTIESYRKYLQGSRLHRIPNQKYQAFCGIDRKTFYKLTNFLDAMSPGSWNSGNLDVNRIKGQRAKDIIVGKVLASCDVAMEEIWIHNLNESLNYAKKAEKRKNESHMRVTADPEVWHHRPLKTLKKRKNRVPIFIKEYCLYNLLRLVKNRPCPLKPYVNLVRFGRPYKIDLRVKLMSSIRTANFTVSQSLKTEGQELDQRYMEDVVRSRRARERAYYTRLKKEKKLARKLAADQRAKRHREEYEKKKAKREKEEAERAALAALAEEEEKAEEPPPAPAIEEPLMVKRARNPVQTSRLNLAPIFTIEPKAEPENELEALKREAEEEYEAEKKEATILLTTKTLEISKKWKHATDRMDYLKSARKEMRAISSSQTLVNKFMKILKEETKDLPFGEDMPDISRKL